MKQSEMENILRRAAPRVVPMGAERARQVLQNALATVPEPRPNRFWGGFRIAGMGASVAALMVCFGTTVDAPIAVPVTRAVPVAIPRRQASGKRPASDLQATYPVAIATTMKRAIAVAAPDATPRRIRLHRAVHPPTVVARAAPKVLPDVLPVPAVVTPPTSTDEPFLFVAATGTVAPSEESLTVTVRTDVPASVPGRAEVATVQNVAVQQVAVQQVAVAGTPNSDTVNVPVWAHVAVETGHDPVMTLTAL